jgi:hypothetical protein
MSSTIFYFHQTNKKVEDANKMGALRERERERGEERSFLKR